MVQTKLMMRMMRMMRMMMMMMMMMLKMKSEMLPIKVPY